MIKETLPDAPQGSWITHKGTGTPKLKPTDRVDVQELSGYILKGMTVAYIGKCWLFEGICVDVIRYRLCS